MKGVKFTTPERTTINKALDVLTDYLQAIGPLASLQRKCISSIRAKLLSLDAPNTNMAILPLEHLLVMSCSKCVVLDSSPGYARASILAGKMEVKEEDITTVGHWMQRQGWINGKITILDVLSKWPSWRAKALAEANNIRVAPGLGGDNGAQNSGQAIKPNPSRPRQGFTS